VPVLSVGEKGYVGMAQVAGSQSLVSKTKAVVQVETAFADKQFRIKLLLPMNSVNPIGVSRVRGLGVSALVDMALSRNAYRLPSSESWNPGDALKAGAIAVGVNQFGPQLNSFINSAFQSEGGLPSGTTKVVPYLSFGSKAYIGMMQVAGPAAQVARVKAVWQFEQLFDGGRIRLRALVPTDSTNPLRLVRVKGVGCTAVIDAMVLRTRDEERHPDHYGYFHHAPVFVGADEDPVYHRPAGWDRGERVGWSKHGRPGLPPGQAKRHPAPILRVPGIKLPGIGRMPLHPSVRQEPDRPRAHGKKDKPGGARRVPPGQAKKGSPGDWE
jgi:hypothetical protein